MGLCIVSVFVSTSCYIELTEFIAKQTESEGHSTQCSQTLASKGTVLVPNPELKKSQWLDILMQRHCFAHVKEQLNGALGAR